MAKNGIQHVPKALLDSLDRPFLIWLAPTILYLYAAAGIFFALIAGASEKAPVLFVNVANSDLPFPAFYLIVALSTAVDVVAARAFSCEKSWAREIFVLGSAAWRCYLFGAAVINGASAAVLFYAMIPSFFILLLQIAYLYSYPPVRRYYGRLEQR